MPIQFYSVGIYFQPKKLVLPFPNQHTRGAALPNFIHLVLV